MRFAIGSTHQDPIRSSAIGYVGLPLNMIKDSIEVDYYSLLKKLGEPSETNTIDNPPAAFQKETSNPPTEDLVEELEEQPQMVKINQMVLQHLLSLKNFPSLRDGIIKKACPHKVEKCHEQQGAKSRGLVDIYNACKTHMESK